VQELLHRLGAFRLVLTLGLVRRGYRVTAAQGAHG